MAINPIGSDLIDFSDSLTRTQRNIDDLDGRIASVQGVVNDAKDTLELAGELHDDAQDFLNTVNSARFSLKLVGKVGALKFVAKGLDKALAGLEDVALKVRDKAGEIDKKIQDSGYIQKLEDADKKLDGYRLKLAVVDNKVMAVNDNTDKAISVFDFVGKPLDPLESLADDTVSPLTPIVNGVNQLYEDITGSIDDFTSQFYDTLFQPLDQVASAFDRINRELSFISGPLQTAYSKLKPIEGVLDAIDFVYKITVEPVVDFLLDKLGIKALIDAAANAIESLLPNPDVLDGLANGLTDAFGQVDAFLNPDGWTVDIDSLVNDVLNKIIPGVDLNATGAIKIGTEADETITGTAHADLLDGRAGNDVTYGGGGNDLIFASQGSDTVYGGAGFDRMVMQGGIADFVFTRPLENGPLEFQDLYGTMGRETVYSVEQFVFDDAIASFSQLLNNVFVGTTGYLEGTDKGDFMYAGNLATEMKGLGGNDRMTGSNFDDTIYGGTGNDVIIGKGGSDAIYGGRGNDTWVLPDDPNSNADTKVDLMAGRVYLYDGNDSLYGIENITIQDDRDTELYGDNHRNVIVAAGGDDFIRGWWNDDKLSGGEGRDTMVGDGGTDTVYGGGGSDVLVGDGQRIKGPGDEYYGGDGFDTLIYAQDLRQYNFQTPYPNDQLPEQNASGPMRVFMETGRVIRMDWKGNVIGSDSFQGVESVVAGDGNDTIFGASPSEEYGQSRIDGGGGNDTLLSGGASYVGGGDGNDVLLPTKPTDPTHGTSVTFDGGAGTDRFTTVGLPDYRWYIKLQGALGTTIRGYDESQNATGSSTASIGGNFVNIETVFLGDKNDEVRLEGNERLTVHGGDGNDKLIRDVPNDGSSSAVLFGEGGDDFLSASIETVAYGGAGNDDFQVNASGSDHGFYGGNGDDFMDVSRMDGVADGGNGFDTFSYDVAASRVPIVYLSLGTGILSTPGDLNSIDAKISNFEQIVGADGAADSITGTWEDQRIIGRAGNDSIRGFSGDDEIYGGSGNDLLTGDRGDDLLHGGPGADSLYGGAGNDTASYAIAAPGDARGGLVAADFGGVTADLSQGRAMTASGTDLLVGIENLVGTNQGDVLIGNGRDNALSGEDGNDLLRGLFGNDVLTMGDGNDTAYGGAGDDTIVLGRGNAEVHGDSGFDTLSLGSDVGRMRMAIWAGTLTEFSRQDVAVWRDTGTTEARSWVHGTFTPEQVLETEPAFANSPDDLTRQIPGPNDPLAATFAVVFDSVRSNFSITFDGIEKFEGGALDDVIYGGRSGDIVVGKDGADLIVGNGGSDRLYGNAAADRLYGGASNDRLFGGVGDDVLAGGRGRDLLQGGGDNDRLSGDAGRDLLRGDAGDDVITGGLGADTIVGGAGTDFARYATSQQGVSVSLNTGLGYAGDAVGDRLFGIVNLIGSSHDDKLFGNKWSNLLVGNAGDDLVRGGSGNDRLLGLKGDDTLYGDAGRDHVEGGLGADSMYGGSGADTFAFTNRNDTGLGVERDRIADFQDGIDKIDISRFHVSYIGSSGFSADGTGEARLLDVRGDGFLAFDYNGDGTIDAIVIVEGVTSLSANSLVL